MTEKRKAEEGTRLGDDDRERAGQGQLAGLAGSRGAQRPCLLAEVEEPLVHIFDMLSDRLTGIEMQLGALQRLVAGGIENSAKGTVVNRQQLDQRFSVRKLFDGYIADVEGGEIVAIVKSEDNGTNRYAMLDSKPRALKGEVALDLAKALLGQRVGRYACLLSEQERREYNTMLLEDYNQRHPDATITADEMMAKMASAVEGSGEFLLDVFESRGYCFSSQGIRVSSIGELVAELTALQLKAKYKANVLGAYMLDGPRVLVLRWTNGQTFLDVARAVNDCCVTAEFEDRGPVEVAKVPTGTGVILGASIAYDPIASDKLWEYALPQYIRSEGLSKEQVLGLREACVKGATILEAATTPAEPGIFRDEGYWRSQVDRVFERMQSDMEA